MDKLKPGYYRLSRDVENPDPDRRKSRDVTALPVWKAGTRIAVRIFLPDVEGVPHLEIEWPDDRHAILTRRAEWHGQYKAIAPALEPIEMDLDLTLHKMGASDYRVLDWLVRHGHVTLAQIEEAALGIDEENHLEDLSRRSKEGTP